MMKKKIYIIQPTYRKMDGQKVKGWNQFNHSYNIPMICGAIPHDWEKQWCIEYFDEIIFDSDASVIFILCMGYDIVYAREIAEEFKRRGKYVIYGSHLDSFSEKLLFEVSDSVIHGSAGIKEMKSMLEDALAGKLKRIYEFGMDLNYPFDYTTLKGIRMPYIQAIMGTGCRNNCDYCCTAGVYKGKYRMRKIDVVLSDLTAIRKLNKYAAFNDSNIYNNALYLRRLCNAITRSRIDLRWGAQSTIDIGYDDETLSALYESGCRILYIGFESLSQINLQSVSKNYNPGNYKMLIKNIISFGINVAGYFMFGFDEDDEETFDKTWDFIKASKITLPLLNVLLPVPGTMIYDRLKDQNRLSFPDESKFGSTNPLYSVPCFKCYFKPKNISPELLEKNYLELYRKVSRIPGMIKRSISISPADTIKFFLMNYALRKEYMKMLNENVNL